MSVNTAYSRAHGALPQSVLALLLCALAANAFGASWPFINELHYDNAGSDQGEGVELLAAAGTNLSGWSLALYNGSNGALYDLVPLGGTVDEQSEGLGTAFFAVPGLQNGPDAIALVAPDATVVQFLSYEGSFAATDGPADTLTSTDILVVEDTDTPLGTSLQLIGRGREADDFRWVAGVEASYGELNAGQEIAAVPLPPGLPLLGAAVAGLLGLRRSAHRDKAPAHGTPREPQQQQGDQDCLQQEACRERHHLRGSTPEQHTRALDPLTHIQRCEAIAYIVS